MSDCAPVVAVLLGTDHHPFDRLVSWAADLSATGADVFIQHGSTTLIPGQCGAAMLPVLGLDRLLDLADIVVAHGGPGTIMDARAHGHLPVVVPRDPRRGEHVDDHQQRFVRRIAGLGVVVAAETQVELELAVTLGRRRDDLASTDGPEDVAVRFGRLVDVLVNGQLTLPRP